MKTTIQTLLVLFVFTVLCGGLYPLTVWVIAQAVWPKEANGSLISDKNGKVIGSTLLAQKFEGDGYFYPRPSAADFATTPSSASNLGPTSTTLKETIAKRRKEMAQKHNVAEEKVPDDLVTSSGSGLDPDLSVAAAQFQINRVAKARHFNVDQTSRLNEMIQQMTHKPTWGLFGDPCVNVLELNQALDNFKS